MRFVTHAISRAISRAIPDAAAHAILGAAALGLLTAGCANPQVRDAPPPTAPAAPKPVEKDDAFRDFGGKVVALNSPFRLESKDIVGIKEHRAVISLIKVEWTSTEQPDGKMLKEATVELLVQKGEDSKRKRIEQGDTRTVLGVKITVKDGGEMYSKKRMLYVPWVELVVQ